MSGYEVWLGQSGMFQAECFELIELLKNLNDDYLIIKNNYTEDFDWILERKARENIALPGTVGVYTSGTTSEPKLIVKSWNQVIENKKGNGTVGDRWLLTYSPGRWAGLSVIAHILKHGCELMVPESLHINDICKEIPFCTHISMTPSLFRKALITGSKLENPALKQITFGGEPATQAVLDQARSMWPNAKVTHVYASTELGDLVACSDGFEGFDKLPGVLSESGELIIGEFFTGDLWRYENGRFQFVGRNTDAINVGGAKVMPYEVEKIINDIPGVVECRVFGVSSALLGSIVCAEYRGQQSSMELTVLLRTLLPKYAVPRLIKVEELKLTDAGKVGRR